MTGAPGMSDGVAVARFTTHERSRSWQMSYRDAGWPSSLPWSEQVEFTGPEKAVEECAEGVYE